LKNKIFELINRPFEFLFKWRPYSRFRFLMYFFIFASIPMLAYGIKPYNLEIIKIIIFTIIILYSGFFAVIIWNDICDADIDAIVHPKRAVPLGLINTKKFFSIALVFSAIVFLFSYLINFICFLFVGLAALFVAFHNRYLRRKISIPAYSEIITPLQWTIVPIFSFLAIKNFNIIDMSLLIAFTYFADAAHDIPEGIHDAEGDHKVGIQTYTTSFGEKTASKISFIMIIFAGIIGIILSIKTILTPFFLIPFLPFWIYTLFFSYEFIKKKKDEMQKQGLLVGLRIYRFFWGTYVLIFFDVFIQIVKFHFF
jgi:4-hydroxybenzoate polyprenyltransferase